MKKIRRDTFNGVGQTIISNFEKENITFVFKNDDYDYFRKFFFEVYYDQSDIEVRDSIDSFLKQLFDTGTEHSQSQI